MRVQCRSRERARRRPHEGTVQIPRERAADRMRAQCRPLERARRGLHGSTVQILYESAQKNHSGRGAGDSLSAKDVPVRTYNTGAHPLSRCEESRDIVFMNAHSHRGAAHLQLEKPPFGIRRRMSGKLRERRVRCGCIRAAKPTHSRRGWRRRGEQIKR